MAILAAGGTARAQERGDANCDGVVNEDDVRALVERIFVPGDCGDADPNLDGGTSASDIPAEMQLFYVTPTPTETPVPVPTATPTISLGPVLTFLGIAGSGGRVVPISEFTEAGIPVINRAAGLGFKIVVEAAPGITGSPVGQVVMNSKPGDPTMVPDLQLQTSRDLGNGNTAVCSGGVPGIDPPRYATEQLVADAMNDFACRFAVATTRNTTCTLDDFETSTFVDPNSRIQFCHQVAADDAFGPGDTLLSVRTRDRIGNVGAMGQLIVRLPGTAPTNTPTQTGTATVPPSQTRTPTVTETVPVTSTATRTRTATPTLVPPTPTSTKTAPSAATATPTRPTPTRTATSSGPSPTRTNTSLVSTPTRTPTGAAATPTRTKTGAPGSATATPTRTRTVSPTPTPTGVAPTGPVITFLGIVRADNRYNPDDLIGTNPSGIPIYRRPLGTGFVIVVEGKRSCPTCGSLGNKTFNPDGLPNLQIQANRTLGDGSPTVCDNLPPLIGGVPAVNPPSFANTQMIADAINDLGCRFVDGAGNSQGRPRPEACVLFDDGEFDYFEASSQLQFCSTVIPNALRFPVGDTLITVRLSTTGGVPGPTKQMIVRVAN